MIWKKKKKRMKKIKNKLTIFVQSKRAKIKTMSTEQKSGEDLIEKVEQETAEQTENKTEESTGFDAKAFAGNEETVKEELESPEQSEKEDAEEVDSTEETDEDGFEWGSVEKKAEQPQEEDWDPKPEKKKETVEEAVYDWEALDKS